MSIFFVPKLDPGFWTIEVNYTFNKRCITFKDNKIMLLKHDKRLYTNEEV